MLNRKLILSFIAFAITVLIIKKYLFGEVSIIRDGAGILAVYAILYVLLFRKATTSKQTNN